jgi:hypothetical protein
MSTLPRRWRFSLLTVLALGIVAAQANAVVASEPAIRREAALRPSIEGYGVLPTVVPVPTPLAIVIPEPGLRGAIPIANIQTAQTSSTTLTTITTAAPSGAAARLDVPAGALPDGVLVQLGAVSDPRALITASPPPENASILAGFQVTAGLAGGPRITSSFASPVTLQFSLPAGATSRSIEALQLAYWDGVEWVVQPATLTRSLDDDTLEVVTQLDHFTLFAVLTQPEAPFAGAFPPPGEYDTLLWEGLTNTPVASAARLLVGLRAIYVYSPSGRTWRTYVEDAPPAASDAFTLRNGQLVVVMARESE